MLLRSSWILTFFMSITLLSNYSFASQISQKITIVNMIENFKPKLRPWTSFNKSNKNKFKKFFKTNNIQNDWQWHNDGDYDLLHQQILSPNNFALFVIAHGVDEKTSSLPGVPSFEPILSDINGRNTIELLQFANPNLKYLYVIGCSMESYIKGLQQEGLIPSHLIVRSFPTKVRSDKAIKKTLKLAREDFKNLVSTSSLRLGKKSSYIPMDLVVNRTNTKLDGSSAIISINNKNISVLPILDLNTSYYCQILVPYNLLKTGQNTLVLDSGRRDGQELTFGLTKLSSESLENLIWDEITFNNDQKTKFGKQFLKFNFDKINSTMFMNQIVTQQTICVNMEI